MKGSLGDKQRLLHILDAILEIESYLHNTSLVEFTENSMMRFASIKQIEIIGEAANAISTETRNRFREIEWRQIIGMRNIIVHEYFGIDYVLIWQILKNDIPHLKEKIMRVCKELDSD